MAERLELLRLVKRENVQERLGLGGGHEAV
jgi:hypothetical protein